jgi:protein SCO1/2
MSKLQTALEDGHQKSVRLLSFSVDPEWDTPERLSSYADKHGADPSRWLFLTGEKNAVQHLVKEGFQLAMMNEMNASAEGSHNANQHLNQKKALEQIVHSDRFVLIDPEFRIRAYYRGNTEDLIGQVLHDIAILQHEYELVL